MYGQSADMESIIKVAEEHNLWVVEDNAQTIGADYIFSDGRIEKDRNNWTYWFCISFYPSKILVVMVMVVRS